MAGFDPISNITGFVGKIIDKIFPDKTVALQAKAELQKLDLTDEYQELMGQLSINMKEAEHHSVFVAGWRPCIGWVCAIALFYHYVVMQFLVWILDIYKIQTIPPNLEMGELMTLLLGMLGLGGLHSYDKKQILDSQNSGNESSKK
jgi:hypothetical protein